MLIIAKKTTQSNSFNTNTAKTRTRLKRAIYTVRMAHDLSSIKMFILFMSYRSRSQLKEAKHQFILK